jgi:hypothetical protein
MAWTTTKNFEYAAGNHKVQLWELSADSATLELVTGLNVVDHVQMTKASGAASAASFQAVVRRNVLSATTAQNGNIAITGAVSGNDFFLTVWGH